MNKSVFLVALIATATGLISPPVALTLGIIYGFSFAHPYSLHAKRLSKFLLQASVVGLGFGMMML